MTSGVLVSPSPALIFDEKSGRPRRQRSRDRRIAAQDQMEGRLGIATVAEAVSGAPVKEIFQPSLQMAKVSTAKTSNHRKTPKEQMVDMRFLKKEERLKDFENEAKDKVVLESSSGDEKSLSLEDPERSTNNDALDSDETTVEHYFDTNFEDHRSTSATESVVDTIENFARSISGLSFLSDLGLDDIEVDNIEEKVIQEYGIDYVKKYEKKMGDDDGSSDEESSPNHNTTATTAEILDDIKNTEREGKEVVYDPNQRESRSLKRSLKSIVRSSSNRSHRSNRSHKSNRSHRKNAKSTDGKEIKILQVEDALATRAAAAALANSMILDDIRHGEDEVRKEQDIDKSGSNVVAEKLLRKYSYEDPDDASTENDKPERMEKITIMVGSTEAQTESFIQGRDNQETVLDRVSVNHERSGCNSVRNDLAWLRDEERLKNIATNFVGSDSGSQYEHQNLEVIHDVNGPLIRLPSLHRTSSFKSSVSITSSAYYDNKEVVYDPAAFGLSSRNKNSLALAKKHNSCCDLRDIAPNRRTRSLEDNDKLQKRHSESIQSDSSVSKKPWKIIEDDERDQITMSNQQYKSYPPTESEGVEMQLRLDCLNVAASKKSRNKKERNRATLMKDKRRFFDPENLFCGLKPQKGRKEVTTKKVSKVGKDTESKDRKKKDLQPSASEVDLDVIRKKEKAQNVSMDTVLTLPTDDEDGLSQFQVEVTDISTMTSKDPLIYKLLQDARKPSVGRQHKSRSDNIRKSRSRESFHSTNSKTSDDEHISTVLDMTRISVTTEDQNNDSINLPQVMASAEAKPSIACPVPIVSGTEPGSFGEVIMPCPAPGTQEETSKYGGELVDLLHQISSYVDGIVEKNNYSFPNPLVQHRGASENKKDGNEADDEKSNPRSGAVSAANSVVSATSGTTPSKEQMLAAIYVPTNRKPEKKVESQKASVKDNENEQRKADLLKLFDNSPTRSDNGDSGRNKKSEPHLETPPRSLVDDDLSADSSAILGSSVERSVSSAKSTEQHQEEHEEHWEENPVVYLMKSSPPKAKRPLRTNQKRTTLKRTTHPLRSKAVTKSPPHLVPKAKSIDDDDNDSVGSLPYRCVTNEKPEESLQTKPVGQEEPKRSESSRKNIFSDMNGKGILKGIASQKENIVLEATQVPLGSTVRGKSTSYQRKPRPPTPPRASREESAMVKTGIERTLNGRTNQVVNHDGRNPERQNETSSQSKGYVVDENGFLLDRTAALLEDLDKSASFLEELEKGSESASFDAQKSIPNAASFSTPMVDSRSVTSKVQNTASSRNQHRNTAGFEKSFEAGARKPAYWKPMHSHGRGLQARDRAVHLR